MTTPRWIEQSVYALKLRPRRDAARVQFEVQTTLLEMNRGDRVRERQARMLASVITSFARSLTLIVVLATAGCEYASLEEAPIPEEVREVSMEFAEALVANDFPTAHGLLSPALKNGYASSDLQRDYERSRKKYFSTVFHDQIVRIGTGAFNLPIHH